MNYVEIRLNGKVLDQTDGDDTAIDWTLPSGAAGHAMLACGFSKKGDHSLNIPAGGWVIKPIPSGATKCIFTHDPGAANCSK